MIKPVEECNWYLGPKQGSKLIQYLRERIPPNAEVAWCSPQIDSPGEQNISISYIRCVKLTDITEGQKPWNPERTERLKAWATPDTLRTVKFEENNQGQNVIRNLADLPALTREVDLNKPEKKYSIHNGIHRIDFARKLGMDCILAYVNETIVVKKEDTDQYLPYKES